MKYRGRLGLALLLLCSVGAGALPSPARAGELVFTDPAGDAIDTGRGEVPRPSDPELDLLSAGIRSSFVSVVFWWRVEKLGVPAASMGSVFRWYFTYNGVEYMISAQLPESEDWLAAEDVFLYRKRGSSYAHLPCSECTLRKDPVANTVQAVMSKSRMSMAMTSADEQRPLRPGSVFGQLWVTTQRWLWYPTFQADTAAPPPGTTFAL